MAANRRTLILAGVLVATVAGAAWIWFGGADSTAPSSAPGRVAGNAPRATPAQGTDPGLVDVNLEALTSPRPALEEGGRNPFRFQTRTTPVAAAPRSEATPTVALTPAVSNGPPPPPPISLKFIGIVEKGGTKIAVLSGAGYTLTAQEGQSVDGRYRILKIGVESLDISYLDGRGRQTIRLTGQ